ncbi:MAG: hypothetical protein K2X09_06555, partial [Rickettsiales bacterium]|nr:hypothetical protein [Rickettsiales bacterium]
NDDNAINDDPEAVALDASGEPEVEIAKEPAAADSPPEDSEHAGQHSGRTGRKQRPEKKAANLTAEPVHKVFDRRWEALQAFAASEEMDADGITSFIASGPNEAINLDAETLHRKCDAAKKMLGQVGVDDPKATALIDALVNAYTNHHAKRALGGVSKTGD